MGLLTIKDICDFQDGSGMEDNIALGTGPLLELAEVIDDCWTHDVIGEWKEIIAGNISCDCQK